MDKPTDDQCIDMIEEGWAQAIDGCSVLPDERCDHGAKAWPLALGYTKAMQQTIRTIWKYRARDEQRGIYRDPGQRRYEAKREYRQRQPTR